MIRYLRSVSEFNTCWQKDDLTSETLTPLFRRRLKWHWLCIELTQIMLNKTKERPVLKKRPDRILDLRGAIPPITLLKVSQVFRDMKTHETLEILCRDPETRSDLFKVIPPFSYELIIMEDMEDNSSFRVQMKKKGRF